MKIKKLVVVMLVVSAAISQALAAEFMAGPVHLYAAARDVQPPGMPGMPGNVPGLGGAVAPRAPRESAARDRGGDREQRLREQQEEASQAAEQARTLLATVASIVAGGEDITEEQQKEFGRAILEIRKASRAMTPEDKSDMLLADAWYGYLTGDDAGSCSKKCLSAAKLSPTSDAAYYSLAAFSVLSSEQPPDREYFLRRVRKDAEAVRTAELPFEIDYSPKQAILTGKNISFAGVSEKYFPVTGREPLTCIYVWSNQATALTADEKAYIAKNEVLNEYAKLEQSTTTTDDSLRRSIAYIKELKVIAAESDKLEVLTVNVDTDLESARDFTKKMGLEGGVFAETNEDFKKTSVSAIPQNLSAFVKLFGNTIVLSDKSGQILYAGTDFGLLFRMFVTNATSGLKLPKVEGVKVPSFNTVARPFGGPGMDPFLPGTTPPGIPPQMPGMTPPGPAGAMPLPQIARPVNQASEPNQPTAADPNQPATATEKTTGKTGNTVAVQLSPEDEVHAQNLLQEAQMLRGSYTRLGSSKKLIEVLQEIVDKYPGTPYETSAREIYDDIPDHQKKHYKLE